MKYSLAEIVDFQNQGRVYSRLIALLGGVILIGLATWVTFESTLPRGLASPAYAIGSVLGYILAGTFLWIGVMVLSENANFLEINSGAIMLLDSAGRTIALWDLRDLRLRRVVDEHFGVDPKTNAPARGGLVRMRWFRGDYISEAALDGVLHEFREYGWRDHKSDDSMSYVRHVWAPPGSRSQHPG